MGNRCNGVGTDQPFVNESRAYCDGRTAAAQGALKATNPFAHDPRNETLWDDGWDSWTAVSGNPPGDQDCCAHAYGGGAA